LAGVLGRRARVTRPHRTGADCPAPPRAVIEGTAPGRGIAPWLEDPMKHLPPAVAFALALTALSPAQLAASQQRPEWVRGGTRMTFASPREVEKAGAAGAQVLRANPVGPHYPLRRDGGGLPPPERARLRHLVRAAHK